MDSQLRVVFAVRSYRHLPQFRKAIESFESEGHRVFVLLYQSLTEESLEEVHAIEGKHDRVSYEWMMPSKRGGTWVFHSRELLSYRRHLMSGAQERFYAQRWKKYIHPILQKLFEWKIARFFLRLPPAGWALKMIERFTPPQSDVTAHLMRLNPDVFLASPVNLRYSSMELEYLKAAKALGIPTAIPMASWDNITTKGMYHVWPDRFLAWNEVQANELKIHHGVPRSRIRLVGATTLDQWFPPPAPTSKSAFCKEYGLRENDLIIAYLGSSIVTAGDESWIVEELRRILDTSSDAKVNRAQILLRPHPKHYAIYSRLHLKDCVTAPKEGGYILDPVKVWQLFYDTLYHSDIIVGVNTSAMLDAIVVNKPVIAVYEKEKNHMQMDTYHFTELVKAHTIYLNSLHEMAATIKKIARGDDELESNRISFVGAYLRPLGLTISAGEAIRREAEVLARELKHVRM